MTSQQSSTATQKQQHQSSIESGGNNNVLISGGNRDVVLTQTNLQGSGNLNRSFKKVNSSSSGKPGIRT